jgi:hypothetical protein
LTYLAWVALPRAYAPASIALRVNGTCKLPLHDKAAVLKEVPSYLPTKIFYEFHIKVKEKFISVSI